MDLSTGVPSLADKRYFLSQMSSDASWKGMASTSLCSSLTTLFMDGCCSPMFRTVFRQKSEPEKKKAHPPVGPTDQRGLLRSAVRQAAIPLPGSPQQQDVVTQHLVLGSGE